MWYYDDANTDAIRRSMENFPWAQHLSLNKDVNWQVKSFLEIFMNIMKNFIPNHIKKSVPRDPPWINKSLKTMLKKKIACIGITKDTVLKMKIKNGLTLFETNVRKQLTLLDFCISIILARD